MRLIDEGIYYSGGRRGFLLIHGLGGTPIEMRYVAQALARCGYAVRVPLLAGHCSSASALKATTWSDWYASIKDAHRRMCQKCDEVVVGGLSAGAILALHLAAERAHEVSALVLYAPSLWLDGWGVPWYAKLFRLVTQKWLADYVSFSERDPWGVKAPHIRARVQRAIASGQSERAGIAALPGSTMLELRWLVRKVRNELGNVRQPTLIVHPRQDDRASLRNLEFLQNKLGGLTEALVLDDSYHLVTLDRQRQLVVRRTLEFASALDRARANASKEDDSLEWLVTSSPSV
jgi:carboxylesterase